MLAQANAHPRDKYINFVDEGHLYTLSLPGREPVHPTSTTTLIHKFFPHFDADAIIDKMFISGSAQRNYPDMTKEQIKNKWKQDGIEASKLGTLMHLDIERFLNEEKVLDPDTPEFHMFLDFWDYITRKYPGCKIYRTEWLIYDEDIPLSGSIDCTIIKENGEFVLVDWKRSKEIKKSNRFQSGFGPCEGLDDCNFIHYTLQLNIYRRILEHKYGATVSDCMLAVFHPNQRGYLIYDVDRRDDLVDKIWKAVLPKKPTGVKCSECDHFNVVCECVHTGKPLCDGCYYFCEVCQLPFSKEYFDEREQRCSKCKY